MTAYRQLLLTFRSLSVGYGTAASCMVELQLHCTGSNGHLDRSSFESWSVAVRSLGMESNVLRSLAGKIRKRFGRKLQRVKQYLKNQIVSVAFYC